MEDDLKILKVKYLSNYVLIVSYSNKPDFTNPLNEDDLKILNVAYLRSSQV
jgi:hypothetical protein